MVGYIWKRLRREPMPALAVVLFSLVVVTVLQTLSASSDAQQRTYQQTWRTIPVKVTVTNLSGTLWDDLDAPGWVADVFTGGNGVGRGLSEYMKDVQITATHEIDNSLEVGADFLLGLTALDAEEDLREELGTKIYWEAGYDESIFTSDLPVCLVPESLTVDADPEIQGQQIELYFSNTYRDENDEIQSLEHTLILTAAGQVSGVTNVIYCPLAVVNQIFAKLQLDRVVDSVSATLVDNDLLNELISQRDMWFAKPVPGGTKTEWGYLGFEYYPYALDINDTQLINAAATLENSILVNQICTLLIFVLSAGAGFFMGFLMIRQRKQEITLMRTLGSGRMFIYIAFVFEQMLYIVSGTLIGGMSLGWQSVEQLCIFVVVYFIGLNIALLVMLRKNLLATIKEDE